MSSEIAPAIIFIFLDPSEKVLLTKRSNSSSYPGENIFPGGKVEKEESLEQALLREIKEELGVIPLEYEPLPLPETMYSPSRRIIHPFIVRKWQGQIPPFILDKPEPITWKPLNKVVNSPIESVRDLATIIRASLQK